MAILKCSVCGGELDLSTDMSVGVCQYCDSTITIPKDLDRKGNLYNRAVFLRQNNEFDKAVLIYEDILKEDNADAEAHWGLVLSKFGIEYVLDPATNERIPTCHRTQSESILSDPDYLAALEYSSVHAATVIEEQAKRISEIQTKILEISRKEPPYDIFICYKETDEFDSRTEDSILAQELYYELIKRKYKVFFARKTLESKLGTEYEPVIYAALNSAKVMIVVGTKPEYLNAVWVRNEWSRFMKMARDSKTQKVIIPAYKKMSPYELPNELSNLQSQDMSKIGFMQDLVDGIERCMRGNKKAESDAAENAVTEANLRERFVKNGSVHLKLQNFVAAEEQYKQLVNDYPDDYRGWWGLILCKTQNFTEILSDSSQINVWYKYIRQLAKPEEIAEIESTFLEYNRKLAVVAADGEIVAVDEFINKHNNDINYFQQKINSLKQSLHMSELQYNDQVGIDNKAISKNESDLLYYKKRFTSKKISLIAGLSFFLLSAIMLLVSLYVQEPVCILITALLGVMTVVSLGLGPSGSLKNHKSRINDVYVAMEKSESVKESNSKIHDDVVSDYNDKISQTQNEITLSRMKIAACNNYKNLEKDRIVQFCYALKCAASGVEIPVDPKTKELRDLAYGYKKIELEAKPAPVPEKDVLKTDGNPVIETENTQERSAECPVCGNVFTIDSASAEKKFLFCGACGTRIDI